MPTPLTVVPWRAWAWLIPVVPMVAAFAIVLFGKRSPWKGWGMAWLSMAFVAVYGIALFIANLNEGIAYQGAVSIGDIGAAGSGPPFTLEWGWMVDGLSIMMYLVVGIVGFLVFTYAKGYMEGDIRYTWFFGSFALFGGGMLVLVSAPNLIQLIVGWELVGVASYLLIGHYWEEHENSSAAIKAFLVNKVADVGLFVGAIIIALSVGSFRFTDIMASSPAAISPHRLRITASGRVSPSSSVRWARAPSSRCTSGCPTPWRARPRFRR